MSSILVTGGAGNIASALTRKLAKNPQNRIIVADNLLTGDLCKVPVDLENVEFIKCDVNRYRDISPLFFTYRFDYVFHFAAVVGVQRTLQNPLAVLGDIRGIEHILNLSKNCGVKRVYYSSSSEVYGEPFEIPQNENTTPLNSRLPYAVVKNVGEAYLRTYQKEFGLNFLIFRFFNTYGPNQSEDFVIPRFIRKALNNEDIPIFGDGLQTRTFCYVDDNVDACVNAHYSGVIENETVNIGSDIEFTILSLAQNIIEFTKSRSKIVFLPPLAEGDMTRRKPDIAKMRRLLDRELLPVEQGILNLIEYYRDT
ncbi:MAG: NAD-dependent epimerase/dehydratase family protein [Methylococcaceae bacterium]|nr:NAD-dependent epimerase/dehydratase family protein [Methylococcaceae bacterium]MCI0668279.1 NAD-dependent epimerase/dehydratase family protein [Methylococcaceae bacterium]MCI0732981.1 NAD-dependent epimerase/dehydratase family protein [Methylococcaceae bacterium]